MRRNDVDLLVNACDPDREGEAIFRRIIHHAGVNKPTRRLWVASLEEEAIRQALAAMKPEGDYRGLADSAMIRAKADWLIDMNASRAYSLVYNTRFTVGRVQTPTLAMIVERDRQIESHKPTPFWKVVAPMGSWTLTGTHLENHGTAEALLEIVNQPDFAFGIYAVKRHRQHDAPPRLYDLTNLQKDMSKLHGLTAAHTLTALQSLYEQRLTTYPRTDSRFITHDDLDALRKLTNGDRLASGFLDPAVRPAQPRLELTVNDAKVTGHTAILPTLQASGETLGQLGDDKRLVLTRVVRRMWEAVADDHVHDVTLVVANIDPDYDESHPNLLRISEADSRFTSCSDQTISLGWKGIEPTKTQEHDGGEDEEDAPAGNLIPVNLATGANAMPMPRSGARLVEGKIKPPKPYTEATLLAAMEHASRLLDDAGLKAALDDDESHSGGIGMPATRADRDRETDPIRIRGAQGQATTLNRTGAESDQRSGAPPEGRGSHRRDGTGPLRRGTRERRPNADRIQIPGIRRRYPRRRAVHGRARARASEAKPRDGIVRPVPALRPARRQDRQGLAMLDQQTRETTGRHMEGCGRLWLETILHHRGQDPHRRERAPFPGRRTDPP